MSTKVGKKGLGPRASPKLSLETLEDIQNHYEEKFKLLEAGFEARLDTLHKIIDKKDDAIAQLNKDIGDLKRSFDFMSKETSEIKEHIKNSNDIFNCKLQKTESNMETIQAKTVDLEDRSRRSNLVFFNFKEATRGVKEDCEDMVEQLLKSLNILEGEDVWIDRAHRLGNRRPEHDTKPRPIIVKFSYFKQKEKIIKSGIKFKNSSINVSDDYSKDTLLIHSKLRNYGKDAKENLFRDNKMAITYYKITYRRLALIFTTNKNDSDARKFTKSFSLKDIQENPNWFIPKQQNNANHN